MSLLVEPAPPPTAQELIGRDYLSFSAISTFQACPLRFYFRYVMGLPEETVSASLVFGGAVHAAIEHHYNELMSGSPPPDLDTLLAAFWDDWRSRSAEAAVQFAKGENLNAIGHLADRVLGTFRESDLARPAGTILGIGEELRGERVPGCPEILARVDLIVDEGDALVVTDLKTSRSRWTPGQAEGSSEQLLIYSELARELTPERPLRLEFAVLTKTKTPVVERHAVPADPQRIERTRQIVERVWRAIQSGHFYPSPSPIHCPSCPFREPCRAWMG